MPDPDAFARARQATLIRRLEAERPADYVLPLHLNMLMLLTLVANLQLALRHPGNTGPSAEAARGIIDGIIDRVRDDGYPAHAELMELGNDPAYDTKPTKGEPYA
jgi:hypothetical protein